MRKCGNCKNRCWESWSGIDYCEHYEMTENDQDEIERAADCELYKEGIPDCISGGNYSQSSTNSDYSPGNPWDAPGMSIKDFI